LEKWHNIIYSFNFQYGMGNSMPIRPKIEKMYSADYFFDSKFNLLKIFFHIKLLSGKKKLFIHIFLLSPAEQEPWAEILVPRTSYRT
jgi:hypothetical protein